MEDDRETVCSSQSSCATLDFAADDSSNVVYDLSLMHSLSTCPTSGSQFDSCPDNNVFSLTLQWTMNLPFTRNSSSSQVVHSPRMRVGCTIPAQTDSAVARLGVTRQLLRTCLDESRRSLPPSQLISLDSQLQDTVEPTVSRNHAELQFHVTRSPVGLTCGSVDVWDYCNQTVFRGVRLCPQTRYHFSHTELGPLFALTLGKHCVLCIALHSHGGAPKSHAGLLRTLSSEGLLALSTAVMSTNLGDDGDDGASLSDAAGAETDATSAEAGHSCRAVTVSSTTPTTATTTAPSSASDAATRTAAQRSTRCCSSNNNKKTGKNSKRVGGKSSAAPAAPVDVITVSSMTSTAKRTSGSRTSGTSSSSGSGSGSGSSRLKTQVILPAEQRLTQNDKYGTDASPMRSAAPAPAATHFIYTTGITLTDREERALRHLGVAVNPPYEQAHRARVLVTGGQLARSVKLLVALSHVQAVVDAEWLERVIQQRNPDVPTNDFHHEEQKLPGCIEKANDFCLHNTLAVEPAARQQLFANQVFLVHDKAKPQSPPDNDLRSVIVAGGGVLYDTEHAAQQNSDGSLSAALPTVFVLPSPRATPQQRTFILSLFGNDRARADSVNCVIPDDIFKAVLRQTPLRPTVPLFPLPKRRSTAVGGKRSRATAEADGANTTTTDVAPPSHDPPHNRSTTCV